MYRARVRVKRRLPPPRQKLYWRGRPHRWRELEPDVEMAATATVAIGYRVSRNHGATYVQLNAIAAGQACRHLKPYHQD
jgi:hypothetical protein